MGKFLSRFLFLAVFLGSYIEPLYAIEKDQKCKKFGKGFETLQDSNINGEKILDYSLICYEKDNHLILATNANQDNNITSKINVEDFWKRLKKIRESKYGIDPSWDKNINYCSNWANNIAISKGEGLVISKLVKYANNCMQTLEFMTNSVMDD